MRIPSKDFISVCDTNAGDGTTWHINHDACTMGADTRRRLYVTKKDAYTFLAYCHNCSGWGVVRAKQKHGEWVKYIPRNKAGDAVDINSAEPEALPSDLNYDPRTWPSEVQEWLVKCGILGTVDNLFMSSNYIPYYAYSPSMNRLIIRLPDMTDEAGVIHQFWQGRDCTGTSSLKYYTGIGSTNKLIVLRIHPTIRASKLFITEDITSAIRIANCGYDALPLRGTSCHDYNQLASTVSGYDKTIVWLDDDKAGFQGTRDLGQRLSLVIPGKWNFVTGIGEAKTFSQKKLKEFVDGR